MKGQIVLMTGCAIAILCASCSEQSEIVENRDDATSVNIHNNSLPATWEDTWNRELPDGCTFVQYTISDKEGLFRYAVGGIDEYYVSGNGADLKLEYSTEFEAEGEFGDAYIESVTVCYENAEPLTYECAGNLKKLPSNVCTITDWKHIGHSVKMKLKFPDNKEKMLRKITFSFAAHGSIEDYPFPHDPVLFTNNLTFVQLP